MFKKEIIVTVGPSSISKNKLEKLKKAGADIFRINLSHSDEQKLETYFDIFKEAGIVPSIDTQGPQLRVKRLFLSGSLKINDKVIICFENLNEQRNDFPLICLNHPEVASQIAVGDVLRIDFNGLAIEVINKIDDKKFSCNVIAKGDISQNRAVDIKGKSIKLNTLTDFDKYAINYAYKRGCRIFYCSFVSSSKDIENIRKVLPIGTSLVSKVETSRSLINIEDILLNSDSVLIDRGDLSREISIPLVPIAVEKVVSISKKYKKDIYIATNVLDSMMTSKIPSRAEISDIYNLLSMGVKGIVLAAEVAIGNNPIESVSLVKYLMNIYEQHDNGLLGVGECSKPDESLVGKELYQWL